ncbi:hypothetical protein FZ025_08045 [Xanthomonas hyacinthi]|uniref:Uncharacterized protein n=1 Tax=Xanthomonas hyacinthi TaxID=56455 RepID=A0A2S7EXM6_9XANT|nr:hypothetical protein [Xanthomonas hyacinthi]KLD74870.1 hypothetical protein Y886_30300 [Xanthomonas hyacinthi DSM 19077]PPU97863.1 hypothetical protein XhyaCFBP1156_08725 [Xanthomonas hyacinthi]QGY76615.1 hypothetical protein FZ025_08045 [Xanthomonas hyacinthi]
MTAIVEITLTAAHVVFGGNAGRGRYFYSFSPDVITVGEGQTPVTLIYRLDKEVSPHLKIRAVLNSDARGQIQSTTIAKDGRSAEVLNLNTVQTLIFFSVLVYDDKREQLFSCDPQVGNDPEITPLA